MAKEKLTGGAWKTIRGRHVYIKNGEIVAGGSHIVNKQGSGYTTSTNKNEQNKGVGKRDRQKETATDAGSNRQRTGTATRGTSEGRKKRAGDRADSKGTSLTIGKHTAKIKQTYEAENDSQYTFHEIEGAEAFRAAIQSAKEGNDYGAFVHAYEADEYKDMRTFITPNGEAGFAVKDDGDIVSVFRNPAKADPNKKGVGIHILLLALQNGGKKLDCFDGFLPKLYAKVGMEPVAKLPFNREYAPEGWNYERDGEPDVIFMKHNGDDFETVLRKMKNKEYTAPDMDKVPKVDDYDDGVALQKSLDDEFIGDPIQKSIQVLNDFVRGWKLE